MRQLNLDQDEQSGLPSVRVSDLVRAELSYHANDINHMLIVPSLIAQMLVLAHRVSFSQIESAVSIFAPLFAEELFFEVEPSQLLSQSILNTFEAEGIVSQRAEEVTLKTENPIGYSNLFDLSQFVRPFLVRYLLLSEALNATGDNIALAVDHARAMGATLLPSLVGHYPWFEKDYDVVIAEKLMRLKCESDHDPQLIIDHATALLPPEVMASVNDALRSTELKHIESAASTA